MSLEELALLPRIMQHGLVAVTSSHRLACGHQGNEIVTYLHRHYGQSLVLLRRYLAGLQTPPGWSVLVLVAMVLGSEATMMTDDGRAGWVVHLEAAWKLIQLQDGIMKGIKGGRKGLWNSLGGIKALVRAWKKGIEPELACTHILQIEIFSTTTCPRQDLVRRPGLKEALAQGVLDCLEDRLLLAVSPCPLPVMTIIAEVNDLRLDLYDLKRADQTANADEASASDISSRLWAILTALLCFDAPTWTADIYKRHPPDHPSSVNNVPFQHRAWHDAWTALAETYRSAALIYYIRALQSPRLRALFPEAYAQFTQSTSTVLASYHRSLSDSLTLLVDSYDGAATAAATATSQLAHGDPTLNLSRFVSWPLFIDAYEAVAWGERGSDVAQDKIRRLRLLGREMGVSCLLDAATLLEGLDGKRVPGSLWRWEDAFEWRCIFAV